MYDAAHGEGGRSKPDRGTRGLRSSGRHGSGQEIGLQARHGACLPFPKKHQAHPPKVGSTTSELEKALVQKGPAGNGTTSRLRSGSRLPLTFPSAFASNPAVLRPLHPRLLSPDSPAVRRTETRT